MDKDDHAKITKRAVEIMSRELQDTFTNLLEKNGKEIAKKSCDEDNYFCNKRRVVDWHFYKTALSPYPASQGRLRFFGIPLSKREVHPSCRRIVSDIIEEIESAVELKNILNITGRYIHYIQDMSTPAHVVPVYHGPTYRQYKTRKDGFETFSPKVIVDTLNSITLTIKEIGQCSQDVATFDLLEFFDASARETLNYLGDSATKFTATVDGIERDYRTDVFWISPDDEQNPEELRGFGRYGKWNTMFGESDNKKEGKLDLKKSKTIYDYLLRKMVVDTIKTLLIVKKRMEIV